MPRPSTTNDEPGSTGLMPSKIVNGSGTLPVRKKPAAPAGSMARAMRPPAKAGPAVGREPGAAAVGAARPHPLHDRCELAAVDRRRGVVVGEERGDPAHLRRNRLPPAPEPVAEEDQQHQPDPAERVAGRLQPVDDG